MITTFPAASAQVAPGGLAPRPRTTASGRARSATGAGPAGDYRQADPAGLGSPHDAMRVQPGRISRSGR